jgi:hypothetical protein
LAAEPDLLSPWPYILGALLAHGGVRADPQGPSHLRAATVDARILIEDTAARSPLVRDLVARLLDSDVIVYVEMTASPQIPRARTKLVAASPGVRFLRIGISSSIPFQERGPLLGHELQHAVEIAAREDVRDENALRRLYLQIGRTGSADSFETDAALDVECQVRLECRQHDDCLDAGNLERR